ncbi:putative DNA repair helicase rad5,16, partial [Aspergillus heteromorphus CBS 117.55]
VRSENTHRRGGVFFQKNLPENIMDTAIWTLKNILIQMHSPSQINKPKPESDGESSLSSLADTTEDEFPGPLGAQQPRTQVWEHEPLSDRQRLILKRQSETFDLKDPFWAYARIEAALQLSGPQTIAQAEEMVATAESAESVETDDVSDTTPRKPKRVKKAVDMRKMLDNRVFESSAYQTAENLQWSFDTSTDANDLLIQPTLEDYERISMHEKWLDAQEYQFDNHEEACRNLGIVDKANPRIKGMQRGQELKFWQPVCINRVAEIMRLDLLRGAIIADVVGVGKTWEAVAFLLHQLNKFKHKHAAAEQDKTEPPEGRPVIIIVPPHLIDQWMDEIMSITEEFQVLLYYGDARRQVGSYIKDKLTKKHEIFKGGLESARTIVVTSYQTWEARHGPQAVKAWCGSKKKPYNPANPHMPPDFPGNLNGRFGVAVFDEAHMLRNRESGISFACTWLRAGFRILLTATPFYNDVRDFLGYIGLLLRSNPAAKATFTSSRVRQIVEAPPGTEDERLLCSQEFVTKHILSKEVQDTNTISYRLRKILQRLMIRRTQGSALPIGSTNKIGADIPPAFKKVLTPSFEPEEFAAYQAYEAVNRRNIFIMDREKPSHAHWHMGRLRKLIMGSSWLGFINVESSLPASAVVESLGAVRRHEWIACVRPSLEAKTLVEKNTVKGFYTRTREHHHTKISLSNSDGDAIQLDTGGLEWLLRGAPKMRAMLPIIRDQVFLKQEKSLVWTYFPGEEVYISAVLTEAGVDHAVIHAGLTARERSIIVKSFTRDPDKCMVLVMSYLVSSAGLNLQNLCRNLHLFSPATSKAVKDQSVGRALRVGQTRTVFVYEYCVPKTFNVYLAERSMQKALPGLVTMMCTGLAPALDNSEAGFSVEGWVIRDGELVALGNGEEPQEGDITDTELIMEQVVREI